jgi:hypothetical protein
VPAAPASPFIINCSTVAGKLPPGSLRKNSTRLALVAANVADFEFGGDFTGEHNLWILRFASERIGTITVANLIRDIDGLPVYTDLDETAVFDTDVFETNTSAQRNTYFFRNDNL